jgi:hypothetical protein
MIKTEFDNAIGTVPPSPIDVDRLIVQGRRRTAVRRLAVAGAGGGVAAVALGVTIAFGASPGGAGASVAAGQPTAPRTAAASVSASASAAGAPVPSSTGPTPASIARATANRLSPIVKGVVQQKAPGYTLSAGADGPAFKMKYLYYPDNDSYYGSANLQGPTGFGNVAINVGRRNSQWNPSYKNTCTSAETGPCTDKTDADGTHVLRRVINENGISDNYVIVDRPDGITIMIVAANQGGQTDTASGRQADPVLTLDQLVSIALDRRLTV